MKKLFLRFFFFKQKTAYEIASCLVGSEMCIRDSCNPAKLDEMDRFSEIANTTIRVQTDSEPVAMTCNEAVESGVIPNKFVAYYLGILTEFYERTGIDISKSRFRKLGDKEKAFYAEVAFDFEVETTIGWLESVSYTHLTLPTICSV